MNQTPTLDDDSFVDPAIAACHLALWERKDGAMTTAVQLLVRPADIRGDESGAHPGERFVMVTITREELGAMLQAVQEDAERTGCGENRMLRLLKMLFCRHTHGRLVRLEWDGRAVYECARCGKLVEKPL